MEAIKDNKGLVAVAILLALLIGVSAYNSSNNGDSESAQAETSETQQAEDNKSAETTDEPKETTEVAQETNSDDTEEATTTETESDGSNTEEADSNNDSDSYTYTAQPGDSYSVLARKAVQTYGIVNDVRLSLAQILAAEAKITTEASAEYLNEGQSVSISQADVKSAIDYAQGLSDDEEAAWATYVPYVEFDTRSNGE